MLANFHRQGSAGNEVLSYQVHVEASMDKDVAGSLRKPHSPQSRDLNRKLPETLCYASFDVAISFYLQDLSIPRDYYNPCSPSLMKSIVFD